MIWIPPASDGCFDKFTITAKDVGTGKALATQTSTDALRVTFSGLYPGATYEFAVTANGPAGSGGAVTARAAVPPATLDVTPDAPESLTSVAVGENTAELTWALPAGNPKARARGPSAGEGFACAVADAGARAGGGGEQGRGAGGARGTAKPPARAGPEEAHAPLRRRGRPSGPLRPVKPLSCKSLNP